MHFYQSLLENQNLQKIINLYQSTYKKFSIWLQVRRIGPLIVEKNIQVFANLIFLGVLSNSQAMLTEQYIQNARSGFFQTFLCIASFQENLG